MAENAPEDVPELLFYIAPSTPIATVGTQSVTFACGGDRPPLILSAQGFTYLGERIMDAGEAYRLFMDFLKRSEQV